MSTLQIIKKIYDELFRELKAAGHGAISRVQRRADVGQSYLRDRRILIQRGKTRGFDLGILLRILKALGVDPVAFFARIFTRGRDPVAQLKLETRRLGEPPEIVVRVRDLLLEQGWEPLAEMPEDVRKLDDLRYESPIDARESTRGDLFKAASGTLPLSLGMPLLAVYGSALRMDAALLDQAQLTLMAAYEIAEKKGDHATLGNLLQRSAYVVGDRGKHQQALDLAVVAERRYVRADDRAGIGTALVDQGMWLHYLSRFQESIEALLASLKYLPEGAKSSRFTALTGLGEAYFFLGDLESAQSYAEKAEEYSSNVGPWLGSKLLWSKARIAAVKKDHSFAETKFRQIVEYFCETSPLDYALSSLELDHILLAQGKIPEAYEVAIDTLRIIEPLEDNKLVSGALHEFWQCALAGHGLSIDLIEKTIEKLAQAGDMVPPTPIFKR